MKTNQLFSVAKNLWQRVGNVLDARHLPLAILTAALLLLPRLGHSQELEPRRWNHIPTGGNFGGLVYAYTFGDIYLIPALKIENATFDLQTIGAKYIRSFELLGKSARIELIQPYQIGHYKGLLNGAPATVDRSGLSDTSVRFAVNLLGAPPLAGKEFAAYRASLDSETIVGLGFVLQAPTGQYYEDKLINLGNNRFAFRPQLGVVHNFSSKWGVELTAQSWIFTENDRFYRGTRLQQAPLIAADASTTYTFRPGLWLAGSVGYAGGGITTVNGRSNHDSQENIGWALNLGIPISRQVAIKLGYVGTRTEVSTGLDTDTVSCALSVVW